MHKPGKGFTGRTHTAATRQRISEGVSAALGGRKQSPEHIRRRVESSRGKTGPRKGYKQSPEHIVRRMQMFELHPRTSLEIRVGEALTNLEISYLDQQPVGPFVVDFLLLLQKRVVLECDGEYWHSAPGRKKADRRKDGFLRSRGYLILRLQEKEIKENPEAAIVTFLEESESWAA